MIPGGGSGGLDQAELFTGRARIDRRRLQAGLIEQVLIAGDDCVGVCFAGESNEVIVVGIAQERLGIDRVLGLGGLSPRGSTLPDASVLASSTKRLNLFPLGGLRRARDAPRVRP